MVNKIIKCRCGVKFKIPHKHSRKKFCSVKCQIQFNQRDKYLRNDSSPHFRLRLLVNGARNRALFKGLPFNLDLDYLKLLWEEQGGLCAVSNIVLDLKATDKAGEPRANAPSLDRITPVKGYIKGNVRLVCYQINCAMGPYGLERFVELCRQVMRVHG